jgi:Tol biopolymer transport system component
VALFPIDGGEPRALTKHATSVGSPAWSPDGSVVYFIAGDPATAEERERTRLRDDVVVWDETFRQRQLWKVNVSTGTETQLTSGDSTVREYVVSADGRRIALQRAPAPGDGDAYRGELWVMDANGGNPRALTNNSIEEKSPDLSPDGSQVLSEAANQFFIAKLDGSPARELSADFLAHKGLMASSAAWYPDGKQITFWVADSSPTPSF